MGCPRCGISNYLGVRSCVGCGAPLAYLEPQPQSQEPVTCPACGVVSPWDALYCASCGKLLVTPPAQAAPIPAQETAAGEYMGFWIRLLAAVVDSVILVVIQGFVVSTPLSLAGVEGDERLAFGLILLLGSIVGWTYHTLFIGLKGATPGKMLVGIRVVDRSGGRPSIGTAFVREVPGKIVSELALLLGYIWIAFDEKKQGWHDKIAGTYVVRTTR